MGKFLLVSMAALAAGPDGELGNCDGELGNCVYVGLTDEGSSETAVGR